MSLQIRIERAPNPDEVRLFTGAKLFHPYKLTTCPSCCDIKWTKTAHSLRDLTRATVLPTIIRVESGYLGQGNIDSVSSGQVAVIQGVYKQKRIVAVPCRSFHSHYLSFPVAGYPHKFCIEQSEADRSPGVAKHFVPTTIDSIIKQVKLPAKVRFADDTLHAEYNCLQLVHVYEEMYLYGHNMGGVDGSMYLEVMFIPMYLDVTLNIAEGLVDGNQADWIILKDAYLSQSSQLLQGSLVLGYTDMAMFDGPWNGIQASAATETPQSSSDCTKDVGHADHSSKKHGSSNHADAGDDDGDDSDEEDYHAYLSPKDYIKIHSSQPRQSSGSSTMTEYVQVEGLRGTIGRRMAAVLESLEQDPSQTLMIVPPPRPPKAAPKKPQLVSASGNMDGESELRGQLNPMKEQWQHHSLPHPKPTPTGVEQFKARQRMHSVGTTEHSPIQPPKPLPPPPSRPLPATPKSLADPLPEASTYEVPGDAYEPMTLTGKQPIISMQETTPTSSQVGFEETRYTPAPCSSTSLPPNPKPKSAVFKSVRAGDSRAHEFVLDQQQPSSPVIDFGQKQKGQSSVIEHGSSAVTSCKPSASVSDGNYQDNAATSRTQQSSVMYKTFPEDASRLLTPAEDLAMPTNQHAPVQRSPRCDRPGLHQSDTSAPQQQDKPSVSVLPLQKSSIGYEGLGSVGEPAATTSSSSTPQDPIQSSQVQSVSGPTPDRGKSSGLKSNTAADIPMDFSLLSHKELCECFRLVGLHSCADAFEMDGIIDGSLLLAMDAGALREHFKFTQYDAIKVIQFAKHGWRPR